jgi:RNA polymerase sigma-70 factor, ECF subfamily
MDDPDSMGRHDQKPAPGEMTPAELYQRYAPSVAKFFANRQFSREQVQDLTQDTFLSVLRGLKGLRSRERLEAWVFKIAANKWRNACRDWTTARSYFREGVADKPLEAEEDPAATEDRHRSDNPLRITLIREEHRLLREALAELSPPLQNVVLLRLDQNLSYEEISTVLRIPTGTVKSRLNSAVRQLRDALGHAYGEVSL